MEARDFCRVRLHFGTLDPNAIGDDYIDAMSEHVTFEEVFDTDRKARKAAEEYIRSVRI